MSVIIQRDYPAPPISRRELLRYMGCASSTPETEQLMDEALCLIEGKLAYKVCYCEFPISREEDLLDLGFARTDSCDLAKCLDRCDRILLFAATLGLGLDRLILRHTRLSPAMAVCLQAVGAERIEALCDAFCNDMQALYQEEHKLLRPRFSPGYGDLPLSLQKEVLRALDCPRQIGLSLNDSLLMSPTKSVTAIIGIKESHENT